jgi:hypothetical protein
MTGYPLSHVSTSAFTTAVTGGRESAALVVRSAEPDADGLNRAGTGGDRGNPPGSLSAPHRAWCP